MPKRKSPGTLIREFRMKRKPRLTLNEFAQMTKIDQADLSRIENNKAILGARRALRISRVTGIDVGRLYRDDCTALPADDSFPPESNASLPAGDGDKSPTQATPSPVSGVPQPIRSIDQ